MKDELLVCMNGPEGCSGLVEYHSVDPGALRAFPRCTAHWLVRLDQEAETRRRYGTDSSVPPEDFDPTFAGERWDDDY